VQIAFQNDISDFLISKGRTAVFWNNIYRQSVDKRSINHFWRNMANARDFADHGFDVLMSPYMYYFNAPRTLEEAYLYDPLAIGAKPEAQSRLRGIEGCAWTPRVVTLRQLQNFIYPRLIAIAESGWTPDGQKDWESFRKRLMRCEVLPEELRHKLNEEVSRIDFKPFRSALAGKKLTNGQKPQPIPAGNLACWKSARFLSLDESKAVRPQGLDLRGGPGVFGHGQTTQDHLRKESCGICAASGRFRRRHCLEHPLRQNPGRQFPVDD
jgi:N-acetyl-beta-hexosaminidase